MNGSENYFQVSLQSNKVLLYETEEHILNTNFTIFHQLPAWFCIAIHLKCILKYYAIKLGKWELRDTAK